MSTSIITHTFYTVINGSLLTSLYRLP